MKGFEMGRLYTLSIRATDSSNWSITIPRTDVEHGDFCFGGSIAPRKFFQPRQTQTSPFSRIHLKTDIADHDTRQIATKHEMTTARTQRKTMARMH